MSCVNHVLFKTQDIDDYGNYHTASYKKNTELEFIINFSTGSGQQLHNNITIDVISQ